MANKGQVRQAISPNATNVIDVPAMSKKPPATQANESITKKAAVNFDILSCILCLFHLIGNLFPFFSQSYFLFCKFYRTYNSFF